MKCLLRKTSAALILNLGVVLVSHAQAVQLENPLRFTSFAAIIQEIAKIATMIGLPVAVLFIVYSGFLYVTAQGNEKKVQNAHKTFLWSVVGTALIVGAYVIATAINQFAQSLR